MEFYSLHVRSNTSAANDGVDGGAGPDFVLIPETLSHLAGWFAGPLWFAYHRFYAAMLADLTVLLALTLLFKYFAFTTWGIFVLLAAQRFLVASFAHDVWRRQLARDGYEERQSLLAEDLEGAEDLAMDLLLADKGTAPETSSRQATLPQAPVHPRRRGPLSPFASPFEGS